ncbi:MAG: actin, cytoplasmic 2 [Candidatus Heimdallarchaeota archaeon]|nr:actin, cytoplasmic 2 [Candidatus Heimdallarchaeota archaeon]
MNGIPLVIDNGTGFSKNGFSGENQPRSVFPTLIGHPKYQSILTNGQGQIRDYYIGNEAYKLRGILRLGYPIEHGMIKDWEAIEQIWQYTFQDTLRKKPGEQPVLLTEPPLNPEQKRKKMAEIMFETFNVPAMYVALQGVLSLFASGRTTGVIVDSGFGVTHVVPIYEGFAITHAIARIDLAGRDITNYLRRLLRQQGHSLSSSAELEIVRDVKENFCYIALDPEKELQLVEKDNNLEKSYQMPDGTTLALQKERFLAPEIFFEPQKAGKALQALPEMIHQAINKCDVDIRRSLYSNIVLSGGSTEFYGFKERLHKELSVMVPEGVEIKIIAPKERQYSVWIGGSMLSSLDSFQNNWISHQEYKEQGANVILRCF